MNYLRASVNNLFTYGLSKKNFSVLVAFSDSVIYLFCCIVGCTLTVHITQRIEWKRESAMASSSKVKGDNKKS